MNFIQRTIDIARANVEDGGRPFATVIARDGEILAESPNRVSPTNDPTAHAEILAIREACTRLGTEHLTGCTVRARPSLPDVPGRAVLLQPRGSRPSASSIARWCGM